MKPSGTAVDARAIDTLVATHPDNDMRVFAAEIGGQRVYIKQELKNFPNRAAEIVHGWLAALTGRAASSPLDQEERSIRHLQRRGFIVPQIVHRGADYLVLSDAGPNLEFLMETADPAARETLLRQAAATLRRLHDAGGWHGAAGLRNLTQSPDGIGLIDLENTVDAYMPLATRHMWDVWSLSHSAALFDHTGSLTTAGLLAYGRGPTRTRLWALCALFVGSYLTLKPFQPLRKRELRQTVGAMGGIFAAQRGDKTRP